jgi:hypothetical protein
MAALSAEEQRRVWAQLMREPPDQIGGAVAYSKPELAAAVAAASQWVDDNRASFNAALPAGYRTKATNQQKAMLLMAIVSREVGRYRAREDEA